MPKKLWIFQVHWLKNMPEGLKKDVENSKKDAESVDILQMKVSVIDGNRHSNYTLAKSFNLVIL